MHVVPRQKLLCEKQILEEIDKHQGMFPDYQTHRDRYTEANMACTGTERQPAIKIDKRTNKNRQTGHTEGQTDGQAGEH